MAGSKATEGARRSAKRIILSKLVAALPFVLAWLFFVLLDGQQTAMVATDWDISQNAQAHAAVLGVLAGFCAAIVTILLTGTGRDSKTSACAHSKLAAIATYVCAFLHAVVASFLYSALVGYRIYTDRGGPDMNAWAVAGYAYDLIGAEYLFVIYLVIYGLLLAASHFVDSGRRPRARRDLLRLLDFLLVLFLLAGGAVAFLDFVSGMPFGSKIADLRWVGAAFLVWVVLARMIPEVSARLSCEVTGRLLYLALGASALHSAGIAIWSLYIEDRPAVSVATIETWTTYSVCYYGVALGIFFGILTFCLNRLLQPCEIDAH